MQDTIRKNLLQIQEEIAPYRPNIIAVTKYFDESAIIEAYKAGLRDFAESRVVEASEKIDRLPQDIRKNSTFHLIGHLQTNKVKKAVGIFDYIHSVDSVRLASKISQEAGNIGKVQKILIEINNSGESQKYGFSKEAIFEDFAEIAAFSNLEIKGIMNMAPLGAPEQELVKLFSAIKNLKEDLEKKFNCKLDDISMGMSQDYKIAAREGSTMLRIGRKLFE